MNYDELFAYVLIPSNSGLISSGIAPEDDDGNAGLNPLEFGADQ